MNSKRLKKEMVNVAKKLIITNLNQGSSGNISVRIPKGLLITPSSIPFETLKSKEIIAIDYEGNLLSNKNNKNISKNLRPSSEWKLHAEIFKDRQEVNAILHCHSTNATAISCHSRNIPSFHYMTAIAGGDDIRCSEYKTFGTDSFAQAAIKALNGRYACLLAHHGQITIADTLKKAISLSIEVETLASIFLKSLQIGEPKNLGKEEMMIILNKFKSMSYSHQA